MEKFKCKHENFKADVKVNRHTDSDISDKIVGFSADIKIVCSDCLSSFMFMGCPAGVSNSKATVDISGTELRIPIKLYDGNINTCASYDFSDKDKYPDDKMLGYIEKLVKEYEKEELPSANVPFHYEAEAAAGLKYFIKWLKKKTKK